MGRRIDESVDARLVALLRRAHPGDLVTPQLVARVFGIQTWSLTRRRQRGAPPTPTEVTFGHADVPVYHYEVRAVLDAVGTGTTGENVPLRTLWRDVARLTRGQSIW
jgi:hypothetical protein